MVSISHLHPSKLKTEEKRRMMTPRRVDVWNQALQGASLPSALRLVDLHHITKGAAACCTLRAWSSAWADTMACGLQAVG